MKKFFLALTIAMIALTAISLFLTRGDSGRPLPPGAERSEGGDVPIGGAFTLLDQNGQTVTSNQYKGKIMLVFFGFTHCPDICPVTTATLSKVVEMLGDKADSVVPIFITVDPKRDTPEVMAKYLADFNPRIVGLTGSEQQIKEVESAYKVYSAVQGAPEEAHEQGSDHEHAALTEDYTVNHSGFVYMMGPDGKYVQHFPFNAPASKIVQAIKEFQP